MSSLKTKSKFLLLALLGITGVTTHDQETHVPKLITKGFIGAERVISWSRLSPLLL